MAESLIVNAVNGKSQFVTVPCSDTDADAFAVEFLEGAYAVYAQTSIVGASDTVAVAPDDVNIMFKNKTSGRKGYMTIKVDATTTDGMVFSALIGKTLNGINIDEAYIIKRVTAKKY